MKAPWDMEPAEFALEVAMLRDPLAEHPARVGDDYVWGIEGGDREVYYVPARTLRVAIASVDRYRASLSKAAVVSRRFWRVTQREFREPRSIAWVAYALNERDRDGWRYDRVEGVPLSALPLDRAALVLSIKYPDTQGGPDE